MPSPIEFGDNDREVYLILFGTGLRGSESIRVFIAGEELAPLFAGAQGGFAGVDQINLALPQSLRGVGEVEVRVDAAGEVSNPVRLVIR